MGSSKRTLRKAIMAWSKRALRKDIIDERILNSVFLTAESLVGFED